MPERVRLALQDWECAEEVAVDEWEAIRVQIDDCATALHVAQAWADHTGRRCRVTTSVRVVDPTSNSVEDRGLMPGDPGPLIIMPRRYAATGRRSPSSTPGPRRWNP